MFEYAGKKGTTALSPKTNLTGEPPEALENVRINYNAAQRKADGGANATGIPDDMKTGFENMLGFSFDDVKIHYNSDKPAQLGALAYTQGNQVHIGPGQKKYLGHELGHVVQQKQGRVRATMQLRGVGVNDDVGLEREADEVGAVVQYMSKGELLEKEEGGGALQSKFSSNEVMQYGKRDRFNKLMQKYPNVSYGGVHPLRIGAPRGNANDGTEVHHIIPLSIAQNKAWATPDNFNGNWNTVKLDKAHDTPNRNQSNVFHKASNNVRDHPGYTTRVSLLRDVSTLERAKRVAGEIRALIDTPQINKTCLDQRLDIW